MQNINLLKFGEPCEQLIIKNAGGGAGTGLFKKWLCISPCFNTILNCYLPKFLKNRF